MYNDFVIVGEAFSADAREAFRRIKVIEIYVFFCLLNERGDSLEPVSQKRVGLAMAETYFDAFSILQTKVTNLNGVLEKRRI